MTEANGGVAVAETAGVGETTGAGGETGGSVQTRRLALPRVREYQGEVYGSGARFKLVLCGRRWGKTTVGLAAGQGHGPAVGLEGHDRCDAMSMALQRLRSYVEPYCAVVPGFKVDLDEVDF